MKYLFRTACVAVFGVSIAHGQSTPLPDTGQIEQMSARFAPVDVELDLSTLPPNERAALADLVRAAQVVDALFLRQVSPDNNALLLTLSADPSPLGRARLNYFLINKGPWSRLDRDQPFLPGIGPKPDEANFYPPGATKPALEAWLASLPEAQRGLATGFFTTIRRMPGGELAVVPYSVEYQGELQRASQWLRSAAGHTQQATLKDYLLKRADAFLSNDYLASDIAWMDMEGGIEPTIGPYEVYEDGWFGFKAAFEAFIAVNDAAESAKLARFSGELQGLEDTLPIDAKYRRPKLGASSPIRVVNLLFAAGDGNRGVQTAAFNLPNDERVVAQRGSKRVMLKNFQQAKFDRVLLPSAKITLARSDQALVDFGPFFTHILMHELMHGLGPQTITVGGRATTVRQELKELNGPLEEAKADISGLWALQQLINKGVLPKAEERATYVTFLASAFRTLRFGLTEAHAKGMALQLNYLLDAGAVQLQSDGTFAVNFATIKAAVSGLTHNIMTIQATGDYAKAKAWSEKMMVIRPQVRIALDRLASLPVDIRPRFVTAEALIAP
jgi:hypothetical protein